MDVFNINFNLLKAFWAVYKTGGIIKASRLMSVEPPAVTYQINQLEIQLGKKLFTKTNKGSTPTHDAEILFPIIDETISKLLNSNLATAKPKGRIRVGLSVVAANVFLADFLRDFAVKYPDIQVEYNHCPNSKYIEGVTKGTYDIGIMHWATRPECQSLTFHTLATYNTVMFATKNFIKDNNLSTIITKDRFLQLPFISAKMSGMTRAKLENDLKTKLNVKWASSMDMTYSLVSSSEGIGWTVDKFLNSKNNTDIVHINIEGVQLPSVDLECFHNNLSPAAKIFVEELKSSSV
jgi:DNA-binding transcriptional LysR family regulator